MCKIMRRRYETAIANRFDVLVAIFCIILQACEGGRVIRKSYGKTSGHSDVNLPPFPTQYDEQGDEEAYMGSLKTVVYPEATTDSVENVQFANSFGNHPQYVAASKERDANVYPDWQKISNQDEEDNQFLGTNFYPISNLKFNPQNNRRIRKKTLYKNSRFGKRTLDFSQSGQDLNQLRQLVADWEFKLRRFAERFASNPSSLEQNPKWLRLLQVRNSLRRLLASATQMEGLDQTRM